MSNDKNRELCELLGWKLVQLSKNTCQLVGPGYEGVQTHINEKHMIKFPQYYTDPALIPELMEAMGKRGFRVFTCSPDPGEDTTKRFNEAFDADAPYQHLAGCLRLEDDNYRAIKWVTEHTFSAAVAEACWKALKEGKDG